MKAYRKVFGLSGMFILFGSLCIIGFLIMFFVLPETKARRRAGLERRLTLDIDRRRSLLDSSLFLRRLSGSSLPPAPTTQALRQQAEA